MIKRIGRHQQDVSMEKMQQPGEGREPVHLLAEKVYSTAEIRAPEVSKDTNVGDKINDMFKVTLEKNIDRNFLDPALELIADKTAPVHLPKKTRDMGYEPAKIDLTIEFDPFAKVHFTSMKAEEAKIREKVENLKNLFIIKFTEEEGEPVGTVTERREAIEEAGEENVAFFDAANEMIACRQEHAAKLRRIFERRRLRREAQGNERFNAMMDNLQAEGVDVVVFEQDDPLWDDLMEQVRETAIDYDEIEQEQKAGQEEKRLTEAKSEAERNVKEEAVEGMQEETSVQRSWKSTRGKKAKVDMEEMMEQWMQDIELQKKIGEIVTKKTEKALRDLAREKNLELKDEKIRAKLKEAILHDENFRARIKEEIKKEVLRRLQILKDQDSFRIVDEETDKMMQIDKIQYRGEETFQAWQVMLARVHGDRFSGKEVGKINNQVRK